MKWFVFTWEWVCLIFYSFSNFKNGKLFSLDQKWRKKFRLWIRFLLRFFITSFIGSSYVQPTSVWSKEFHLELSKWLMSPSHFFEGRKRADFIYLRICTLLFTMIINLHTKIINTNIMFLAFLATFFLFLSEFFFYF